MHRAKKHYFGTKDLVTIAVLSSLGAIASTYLGYIGQLLGTATGIPFGGQLVTGLHVLWLLLILALVNKPGSALLGAILDNFVQFLMGSHLGVWVLPVGLVQGILAEVGYWPLRGFSLSLAMALSGGLSSISSVIVLQVALHPFGPIAIVESLCALAFASGAFWGGLFPYMILGILHRAGIAGGYRSKPAASQSQGSK